MQNPRIEAQLRLERVEKWMHSRQAWGRELSPLLRTMMPAGKESFPFLSPQSLFLSPFPFYFLLFWMMEILEGANCEESLAARMLSPVESFPTHLHRIKLKLFDMYRLLFPFGEFPLPDKERNCCCL